MADYLLTEIDVSSNKEFQDDEIIDTITHADLDFINDDDSNVDGVDSCCSANKKLALGNKDKTLIPVLKYNVGKLKIDSNSESEYEETEEQSSQFQILSMLNFQKKQKLSYPKGCVLFMVLITMNETITTHEREMFTNSWKWKSTLNYF